MATSFRNAAVIGTGMMGPGIALTLAFGGARSLIVGRTAASAAAGLERAQTQARVLEQNGLEPPDRVAKAIGMVSASCEFEEAIRGADLVVESAPEDMEFKRDLFARMDAIAPADTILASNTSGLSITAIAAKCARPERVLTTHFWNPPHLMPLVEIVKGERTSLESAESVRDFLARCGKTPVLIRKDRPGQLGNRLQMALLREAINIVAEGIAEPEDVDAVAKNGFGIRLPAYGIFEHQDIVGLDLGSRVLDYVSRDLYNEPRAPEHVQALVRAGHVGARVGRGYYDWSVLSADDVKARRDAFLIAVLRYRQSS